MKKILSLLVAILLILNVTNSKATEEVNGDISPDEGFSGNPSDSIVETQNMIFGMRWMNTEIW